MLHMRTTVTLDPDVERLLKEEVHRTRSSFKAVLNNAVRASLGANAPRRRQSFEVQAQPMHLRAGIDPGRLGELKDDLDVEAFLRISERLEGLKEKEKE